MLQNPTKHEALATTNEPDCFPSVDKRFVVFMGRRRRECWEFFIEGYYLLRPQAEGIFGRVWGRSWLS
jgi:hypothetical protein